MSPYIPSKKLGKNGYIKDNSDKCDYSITPMEDIEWCQFCAHYGWVENYNACGDGCWLKIMRDGVESVSYCGWCKHFLNKNSEEGKKLKYSRLKQYWLNSIGFQQDREK